MMAGRMHNIIMHFKTSLEKNVRFLDGFLLCVLQEMVILRMHKFGVAFF